MEYGATAPAGPLAAPTRRRRGVAGLAVATLGAGALLGLRVAGPSRARLAALVARPHTQTLVDPVDIRIAVSNEYGPCETDKYPFLYGIDDALLVEPHKTTSLTIENSVRASSARSKRFHTMSTRVHPIDPLDVADAGRKSPAGSFGLLSAISPPKKGDKSSSDEEEYAACEAHQGRPRADSNASSTASTSSLIDEWWKKRGQRDADMRRGAAKSDAAAHVGVALAALLPPLVDQAGRAGRAARV